MIKAFQAILSSTFFLLLACSSPKKTSQTASNTSATNTETDKGNPTLKKLSAKMLDENTFMLEGISDDSTYGYHMSNAIKVSGGPTNERRYLNALLGPNGEPVSYFRHGSCCPVKSDNGMMGMAMLDIYEIKYEGIEKPVILYLNMYDPGILKAPVGFTFKK